MTVTIKAKALEAFVADIFASAGCSQEEGGRIGRYLVSANLSGHDSHGVVRVPRYAIQKKNGTVVRRRHGRGRGRHAGDRRRRRQVRLRPDGDATGRAHRHREVPEERPLGGDAAQRGPRRPRRRLGRDGGRSRPGVDPLRQRLGQRARGTLWRRRAALLDRALLRRHPASRHGSAGPRLRHLDRGRGQGPGGEPGRQEGARRRADRPRRQAQRRSAPALRRLHADRAARTCQGHRRHPGVRRPQGLRPRLHVRDAGRIAQRQWRDRSQARPLRQRHAVLLRRSQGVRSLGLLPRRHRQVRRLREELQACRFGGEVLVPGEPEQRMRIKRLAEGVPLPDDTWAAIVDTARSVGLDERRIQLAVSP